MIIYKDNRYLDVEVIYKKIKNLYIRVRSNKIIITASPYFDYEKIKEIILNNFEKYYSLVNQETSDKMSYLGNIYNKVAIKSNKNEVIIDEDIIYVYYKNLEEEAINEFYISECLRYLNELYPLLEAKFSRYNISCKGFKVGIFKSFWGSCNRRTKIIKINAYLMRHDIKYLDLICHHEYCHFRYPNHQKEYHDFYDSVYKNNKELEKRLKKLPTY